MSSDLTKIFDPHQLAAYKKFVEQQGGILWMNVGDGKTRVGLKAAVDIAKASGRNIIPVVCRRAAFYDWIQEIATLQLNVNVGEIETLTLSEMRGFKSVWIILISEGMLVNAAIQYLLTDIWDMIGSVIVDELWLFKNPRSQKHKALRAVLTEDKPTIGLSGSVMTARDIVDIFGQVAAVGRMQHLARHLTHFREQFQTGIQGDYFSWYPKPGAYKAIMEKIEPFVYIHMPRIIQRKTRSNILKVPATEQQLALFKELKETAAIEGKFELTNVANIVTKAQQISNGWLKGENGDVECFPSPKVDRCFALVEEILQQDETTKVVVWCAFRNDIARLLLIMPKLSKIAMLQSGLEFDTQLWKRSDCRICLATEASGTSINHFAQVPYGIYFSQDFKWTSLQQSQGRHTRRSSLHDTAYFTFLHTEKSLDAQVFYTVKTAASSEDSFIKQMNVLQWLKEK